MFRWLTEEAPYQLDAKQQQAVKAVTICLADNLDLKLFSAAQQKIQKIQKNAERQLADKVKGSAKQYDQYSFSVEVFISRRHSAKSINSAVFE